MGTNSRRFLRSPGTTGDKSRWLRSGGHPEKQRHDHMTEPKISLKNLTKIHEGGSSAPVTAFSNVTLSIAEGEFICILGPSGCGKSTFLLCIAGLDEATSGEILINGKLARGPGSDRGFVFQEYALFPWRTVRGNVAYGPEAAGFSKEQQRQIADRFIRM